MTDEKKDEKKDGAGHAPAGASKKMSPFLIPVLFLAIIFAITIGASYAYPERRAIEWTFDWFYDTTVQFGIVALVSLWIVSLIKKKNSAGDGQ